MAAKKSPPPKPATRQRKPASKSTRKSKSSFSPSRRSEPQRGRLLKGLLKKLKQPGSASQRSRTVRTGLSIDRKLDLTGIGLALVGLFTLLSLLSAQRAGLTQMWYGFLVRLVGWGVWIFPFILMALGLWLVMRNLESLPQISLERIVGFLLLYWNILGFFHMLGMGSVPAYAFAEAGKGGGYAGAVVVVLLTGAIGRVGSVVFFLAWLVIALAMALDLTVADLFRWVPPLVERINRWLAERNTRRHSAASAELPEEFTPLQRSMIPTGAVPAAQAASTGSPEMPVVTLGSVTETAWVLPSVDAVLENGITVEIDADVDEDRARLIEETLASFGAPAHVVEIHRGPTITQFGVEPDFVENRAGRMRVRVSKIVSLADDLALALAAPRIRIQAPVPGRNYVGIEVPNVEASRVALRDILASEQFKKLRSPLRFALGKDVAGAPVAADLTVMPHLLIAGTTGSGKSVCVNAILMCLLMNNTPDDLRLILVDPKRVELTGYNGIPHLLAPVVVDAERVVGALQWMMREMDNRYHKFAQAGARNIVDYNAKMIAQGQKRIPYLVIVIDELADLMMLAPDETERTITRLAQLARATGLHLIIATQRPSVDVVTGLIKANFPARVAFAVASGVDSRVILDQPGAERLLGRGDMLYQSPDAPAPVRLQGVFVSEEEINRLVTYWQEQNTAATLAQSPSPVGQAPPLPQGVPLKQSPLWEGFEVQEERDPLLGEAIELVRREGRASISMLQRRMRIGYTRAARLIDTMEEKHIISAAQPGSQVREVLDYGQGAPPIED